MSETPRIVRSVESIVASEIRDAVEPVACTGPDDDEHERREMTVVDTGVGTVVYECPACDVRVLYAYDADSTDDDWVCCGPRK